MQKICSLFTVLTLLPTFAHAAELAAPEMGTLLLLCLGVLGLVVRRQMNFKRRNRQAVRQEPVVESRGR